MPQSHSSFSAEDRHFMALAFKLAAKANGYTSPNPLVGAVIVKDGHLVGKGYHHAYGKPHAEVEALHQAGFQARGATLYVTLEPCNHHGQTPPCTEAILAAGILRVVIANLDPNPRVVGGGADFLRSRGLIVDSGLMAGIGATLNEAFFKAAARGLPFVIAKAAASLDGKIATRTNDSHWITGDKARNWVHRLRHQVDAILVGVGTVIADNPQLTTRLPKGKGKDATRIILDSHLRLPLGSRILTVASDAPTWVVCLDSASPEKMAAVRSLGPDIIIAPPRENRVDLAALLTILGERRINSLLVEGGAEVHGAFFAAGLVDKFHLFLAPKFIGGRDAPGILGGLGIETLNEAPQARDVSIHRLGPDILISGYLGNPPYNPCTT